MFRRICLFALVASGMAVGQQPQQAKPLQFEVAAIKPGNPQLGSSASSTSGDQFRMVNTPLKQWVEMGLSVRDYALKAPSWLDTSRFDMNAKLPAGQPLGQKAMADMMKALLVERFGLKWHEEQGVVTGYELVPDKKVLLEPASLLERLEGRHGSSSGPTLIGGTNMSMSELALALGDLLGRPVVDRTQISGGFDVKLMWRPLDDARADEQKRYGIDVDNLPSTVFSAVRAVGAAASECQDPIEGHRRGPHE
ncbi:MAG: TIGR03435 family protein [Acidobacteriota bacterium]|nr:TIGR03435 family protein [Acidobacteriota bacterium]